MSKGLESLERITSYSLFKKTMYYLFNDDIECIENELIENEKIKAKIINWIELLSTDGINAKKQVKQEMTELLKGCDS